MIELNNLCFLNILKGVNASIPSGKITFVVGKNGSGKSTLVKCINSLLTDYSGSIYIEDKDIKDFSRKEFAKTVCYIPQKMVINYDIKVADFLLFSRYSHISNRNNDLSFIDMALKQTGLVNMKDRNVRTLSGGEFQKVMIASAIVQDTKYWILDEPSTALDPGAENDFIKLLSRIIKESEKTALVVSHNMNHVLNMADNIIALDDGRIIFSGNKEDFKENILTNLFGVDFKVKENENGEYICYPAKIL